MAKINAKYEVVYIVNSTLGEEEINGIVAKFKSLIEENAAIDKHDEWGKRRMAYAIQDMYEGYYVYASFTSKPEFPAELDRVFKITDGILRSMIVNIDEK